VFDLLPFFTFGIGSDTAGPDGISAKLIDKAHRSRMLECLGLLWNQLWCNGKFVSVWKKEDRVVIPKPGKKDYHESAAYRTVAITSMVGKRFEHITARRLTQVLDELQFDPLQFAYLRNRSTTEAILLLTELIKKPIIEGYKTGQYSSIFQMRLGVLTGHVLCTK